MRDDNATPGDRDDAHRANVAKRAGVLRTESEASNEPPDGAASDAPAPLSALSHPADAEEASLTDDEIDLYRRRVAEGLYNSREVADEVARRMMRRGDI